MKKLMLFVFISILPVLLFSQNDTICGLIPSKDKKVCYDGVVNIQGQTASTIYANAKSWVATNFGSAKSVIETDVENSLLVLKGILTEDTYTTYKFTLTLQFKDGRYKYTLTDLKYKFMTAESAVEDMPFMSSCIEKTAKEFNTFFVSFIDRFKLGINKDNNW